MELWLEFALLLLLTVTLFHAIRLERALGVLRRDRAVLEALVASFTESTAQAQQSTDRLRSASEGAGRQIARQIEGGTSLRHDLAFLIERGDATADRLDVLVRGASATEARVSAATTPLSRATDIEVTEPLPRLRSQAERDLVRALKAAR